VPSSTELLAQITHLANTWAPVAIAWHLVLAALLLAILGNWRPRERTLGWLFGALAASVAFAAWSVGNPFNAISFGLLSILLIVASARAVIPTTPHWQRWPAAGLILYGGVYPHFLHAPALTYVIAAPVGVIPCPTLAMVAGLALLTNVQSRAVLIALITWSTVYAAIGVLWFGLWLDVGLVAAAGLLIVKTTTMRGAP
jgi:hypothetical protein